ncbi:hypothetical protein HOLleu_15579 [Holothuria leucospilota]|uniref:Secreted protein n=1 Tax=Holothuria leucospilota TaxID=206669 RepID=A0A9Q1C5E0_HOLLE|nr:hypothetical protein HOLleu_15579 [Holothuria leucospilota]
MILKTIALFLLSLNLSKVLLYLEFKNISIGIRCMNHFSPLTALRRKAKRLCYPLPLIYCVRLITKTPLYCYCYLTCLLRSTRLTMVPFSTG